MVGAAAAIPSSNSTSRSQSLMVVASVIVAAVFAVVFARADGESGAFWVIGLGLGVVLQRSRFCFAGSFRDFFMARDGRLLRALLGGLLIATPAFAALMSRFVPDPTLPGLPPGAHIVPIGLHLVVGGLLFGIGMVVAGGCVSGTLFRIGEGYVQSMVALLGIGAGLVIASHTWNWWWVNHIGQMPSLWLPSLIGYGPAVVLTMLVIAGLYLLVTWWEMRDGPGMPSRRKSEPVAMSFGDKVAQFRKKVFVDGWPYWVGGIALALLNIYAYVAAHPLGVTGEISTWATRFTGLFGISTGPLLGVDQFAGCNLALGETGFLTGAFTLDTGLIFGSFIAALASSEFKIRFPRQKSRYLQAIGGGVLMGYGAGIAIGCTVGAFFSAVPSLAPSGWIFGLSLAGGAFLGTLIIRRLP